MQWHVNVPSRCRMAAAPLTLRWRWARRLSLCKLLNVRQLQRKTRNSMKKQIRTRRTPRFVWNRSCLCAEPVCVETIGNPKTFMWYIDIT